MTTGIKRYLRDNSNSVILPYSVADAIGMSDGTTLANEIDIIEDNATIKNDILPYKEKTYQLKGQMHCHTTTSDGLYDPASLLTLYKNAGYDFVSITDHDKLNLNVDVDGIVHIRSSEYFEGANHNHLCAYNVTQLRRDIASTMIDVQDGIDLVKRSGGLTSIPHPQMGSISLNSKEALSLQNYDMMEIYTAYDGSFYDNYIDSLFKLGKRFNLLSVDDFHNETSNTFNGGWIVVNSNSKDQNSILREIKNGNYYSTNGNDLRLSLVNGVLTASSTASSNITFVTDKGRTTSTGISATYTIKGDELYIRVESKRVSDSKIAWSNPIFLNKKDINLIKKNLVKTDLTNVTTLTNSVNGYGKDDLVFVGTPAGNSCSVSNGVATITSGADTSGNAGLLYALYDKCVSGRTVKLSFDIERISGNQPITASIYYNDTDMYDINCSINRVSLIDTDIYCPIKTSANNIDNFVHYEMQATIPYNVANMCTQVKISSATAIVNTVYKVKNYKIECEDINTPTIPLISNPNLLINGDFKVWQRGTSFAVTNSQAYTADRWSAFNQSGTCVIDKVTDGLRATRVGGATSNILRIVYNMEDSDYNKLLNKTVTLTFNYQSNAQFYLYVNNGAGFIVSSFTLSPTATRASVTFTLPSSLSNLSIFIQATQADATITLKNVKLELGDKSTPFASRTYAEELAMCQRYFQMLTKGGYYSTIGMGTVATTTMATILIPLPVSLRSTPTVAISNKTTTENLSITTAGVKHIITTIYTDGNLLSNNALTMNVSTSDTLTVGQGAVLCGGSALCTVSLDSEVY